MDERSFRLLPVMLCLFLATACGGGGGGGSAAGPPDPPPPPVSVSSYVKLTSDTGDYIGAGRNYSYTKTDAVLNVTAQGGHLSVAVHGNELWQGDFQLPNGYASLQAGTFNGLTRYPFHDSVVGGLSWTGEGRGCNTLAGSFTIKKVTYDGNTLAEIDLQFEQYCEGGSFALRGEIYWNAKDTTSPPGPVTPPSGLWRPAVGVTPASGNYVYLESQAGDDIGRGGSYLYTEADAMVSVSEASAHLSVGVNGDQLWTGDFQAMDSLGRLEVGYYGDLRRYPFHNPVKGGLSWWGEGRSCNTLTGWFVVDSATYSGSTLTAIDLRFEQHCEGGGPALHGKIHWDANDSTSVSGPVAPPAGLWQPAPGATPATGNYVYLESQSGDYIGEGRKYLYTQANAIVSLVTQGARLSVGVSGDQSWSGNFQAMNSLSRLEVGYYGDLRRYPFHNPVKGGLDWSGDGRGCNTLTGWFVVDSATFSGSTLIAVDLRFEQHCDGNAPALRGKIHWDGNDTTSPPGPVAPPLDLWQPAPDITPATGNYVYLESQTGDYIGQGGSYLYTQANAVLSTLSSGAYFSMGVEGDQNWSGDFQAMSTLSRLEVGYYGDLQRYPFQNPTKGGLSWSGEGRGCNRLTGWFVVDDVVYSGPTLVSIDLRFEQHCDGSLAALRGKVHWDASDTTSPPGPAAPPTGLWQPAPGATPATGNYVYLESQPGDFVGLGSSDLYTQANAILSVNVANAHLSVGVNGDQKWNGDFQAMNALSRLEVGYYGDLQRYPFHNPVKGGLDWSGEGRGCNTLTGWFVVDGVTYSGPTLTAIDLRFEQHCEGVGPALHGKIHWVSNDSTSPPGPAVPPSGLWQPAPGTTPASGVYVYLESQPGDFIGQGGTYLYTPPSATFSVSATGAHLAVLVKGDQQWNGDFQGMNSLSRLEAGFYGDLQRYPFHNPVKGGFSWSGGGLGCNALTGWFVVDSVTYAGSALMAIDLRFEQHCEGSGPALRGKIHWTQ